MGAVCRWLSEGARLGQFQQGSPEPLKTRHGQTGVNEWEKTRLATGAAGMRQIRRSNHRDLSFCSRSVAGFFFFSGAHVYVIVPVGQRVAITLLRSRCSSRLVYSYFPSSDAITRNSPLYNLSILPPASSLRSTWSHRKPVVPRYWRHGKMKDKEARSLVL